MAPVSAFRVRPSSISIRDISDIIKRHTLNYALIKSRRPTEIFFFFSNARSDKKNLSGRVVRVTREWEEPLVGRQFVMIVNNLHKGFFAANQFIEEDYRKVLSHTELILEGRK